MVTAGLTTAIAVRFATKNLEDRAILAARAKMQKLMMASLSQNDVEPTTNTEFVSTPTTF